MSQIFWSRYAPGIDWGKPIRVLVGMGPKELWWIPGSSYRDNCGSHFEPGQLLIVGDAERYWKTSLGENQVLGEKFAWRPHAKLIDDAFGIGTTANIRRNKTWIVSTS